MANLQKGIELVGQAIQQDSAANLPGAINLYQEALSYLETAFNEEVDLARKNQIFEKMREYNDRMQLLNETVQQMQSSSPSVPPTQSVANPTPSQDFQDQVNSFNEPMRPQEPIQQAPQSPYNVQSSNQSPAPSQPSQSYANSPYEPQYSSVQSSAPTIASPYASNQPQAGRAPYDLQKDPTPPYSAPYDSSPYQREEKKEEMPQYNAAPPTNAWEDSFTSQSPYQSQNQPTSLAPPMSSFQQAPVRTAPPDFSKFGLTSPAASLPAPGFNNPNTNPSLTFGTFQGANQGQNHPEFNTNPNEASFASLNRQTSPNTFQSSPQQQSMGMESFQQGQAASPSQYAPNGQENRMNSPQMNTGYNNVPQNTFHTPNQSQASNPPFGQPSMATQPPQQSNQNINHQQSFTNMQNTQGSPQNAAGEKSAEFLPFLVSLEKENPKSIPNIQVALLVAEEAKKADKGGQYQNALDLYTECLERLILLFNRETNANIKQTLQNTIQAYMQRAEKIKHTCRIVPRRIPDQPVAQQQRNSSPIPSQAQNPSQSSQRVPMENSRPSGGNTANSLLADGPSPSQEQPQASFVGKPIQITNETKSLMGRQKLRISVTVANNLVFPGDKLKIFAKVENRSTMVVQYLKVTLRRIEKTQKYDAKGRQVMATDALKIHRQEFYQGSIFPLAAESNYSGDLLYTIPHGLKATNTSQRGTYEREYDLCVQCEISMRKNLHVRFPLVIGPDC